MKSVLAAGAMVVVCACAGSNADSTTPKLVTLSPDGVRHIDIAYAPDGAHMSWWAPAPGTAEWHLWVGKPDMSDAHDLGVTSVFTGSSPVWSPDGSRIAALSNKFGVGGVVIAPVAGGEATRATQGAGVQIPLAWNRDGDRLTYYASVEGSFRGFRTSLSTGKSAALVPDETHAYIAAFSPDGSHIGYMVIDGQRATIWVADSTGHSRRQLTTEGFETFSQITGPWSPDGKEILYESRRTGTSDLWAMPVDGGKPHQLTRDVRNDYNGAYSSDGQWIVFQSDRGRQVDVWVVPAAGGAELRVTDTPAEEGAPIWRPHSSEVAFVTTTQKGGVWVRSLGDGKERRLTPDSLWVTWFNMSPDGKQINYVVERGGGIEDLAVMPVDGGASRTLVSGGGSVTQPRWSPDGSKIVFTSDRGGTSDVWVIDAAGGAPRQIENWPGTENNASWSPDGSTMYFVSDRESRLGDVWKVPTAGGEPVRVTKIGNINGSMLARTGVADIFPATIGSHGQLTISRVAPDGKVTSVWDRTNAFAQAVSPSGNEISAYVEQPDGSMRNMILPANGSAGRVVLKPNESTGMWSPDGKSMLYYVNEGGVSDIGILNLADGTTNRLTTTPESEVGGEWMPDGKSIVFTRKQTVQRVVTADLTKLLAGAK